MNIDTAKAASDLLVKHWQAGTVLEGLPEPLRPESIEEGYLIQAQVEAVSAKPLFGWKIAATSLAGQRHIGVDGPIAGRLLAEMVYGAGDTVAIGANRMCVAEAEFAFRMGESLDPRTRPYEVAEVMEAVSALHLAIELPDSRYRDFVSAGGPQLIADNACAHRFVLGPEAPAMWRDLDLRHHRVVGRVGQSFEREGIGSNVLGDPRIALTWLANELSRIGVSLGAGQVVTTGTCLAPMDISAGDVVAVDYGSLGSFSCRIQGPD